MKLISFASCRLSLLFLLVFCGCIASYSAKAADDLPPPQNPDGVAAEPPTPPPQEPTTDEDSIPSLGGAEDLPAPSLGEGKEDDALQVNKAPQEDDIFLPTPQAQDEQNYIAPINPSYSNYNNSSANYDNGDWRTGLNTRPVFNLFVGYAQRSYISTAVPTAIAGPTVGAFVRLFDLGQTVFLHIHADMMNFKVGDIKTTNGQTPFTGVNNLVYHVGPVLEVGIGRRLSLYGSLLRRIDYITADPHDPTMVRPDIRNLNNVGLPPAWMLGLGLQYDFYVIPHGSMGIRGHVEKDLAWIGLSLSLEPIPKRKLSL